MPIKRRRFVQNLLATSAAAPVLGSAQPPPAAQQQPTPQPNTPARQEPRQPQTIPTLKLTQPDLAAETFPLFFTADQFATLKKLGGVLMPAMKGNPGALEAKAPEFLDFLLSVSLPERQKTYKDGLDHLNSAARSEHQRPFAELNAAEIDGIIRPLIAVRFWPEDLPKDPMQSFMCQVHEDLRTATMNSREWAAAAQNSGHRFTRGFRGSGLYWAPVDPVV
jgi:hypothetical protein